MSLTDILAQPTTFEAALTALADAHSAITELDSDPAWGGCSPAGLRYRLRRLLGGGYGVVVLDLDNLHELNDRLGHTEVDRRMREAFQIRHSDTLRGRWQFGDEVVLIVPSEDAKDCAQRLLHDMQSVGLSATFAVVVNTHERYERAVERCQGCIENAKRNNLRGRVHEVKAWA